ncbi:LLM class flavin-dependent oxidoreductase [Stutzerimonas kirkiae]|uniref:LLM class flavin-dependent oxidoreductase n=1 Tax=Stutzerimonas kirkiae TaxID=2211392 RepID=A0A4Q9QWW1_9GAMM|nr:LLM class flavin-dependent oxidoreductase [Stutzerimonas kirkiae]TBU87911.1 LLM class flavin-dependent oxidoreductase [Stutzerimonas kirkiae]TBV01190.1 LLM class flavin-dependent oxidoreductase [Stutzerimonas kirkiae]TBV13951.1 LLM class flavin-dependent oxidoreductase [Stutzerimonas kirkiae]
MSGRLRLGFLNRVYSPAFSPQVYQDALELFVVAEELGFDSGWVAQHHFACESGRLPSPLPLLAAAAQRTRRIALGTGIIVLPHEPTLRLAEDAAVLDLLASGRLQLGLGAGFDPQSFAGFGQDLEQRHSEYDSRIARLAQLFAGAGLNAAGQVLAPAASGLLQRTWEATSRVEQVAERGNGLIVAPNPNLPPSASLAAIERYRAAWRQPQRPARIALVRAVFPGSDASDPDASLQRDIRDYIAGKQHIGRYDGAATEAFSAELERLDILHGDPAGIALRLAHGPALGPDDQLVVQVQTRSTTLDEAIRHLQWVAREIAPALGWQPASTQASPQELTHP